MRVPSFPGEYYAVWTADGEFKVLIKGAAEIPLSRATLAGLSAHDEPGCDDEGRWTVAVVDLVFPSR